MGRAFFTMPPDVLYSLLRSTLQLPEDATITGIYITPDAVQIHIEHKDLPQVGDGQPSPIVSPLWEPGERVDWKVLS